MIPTERVLIVYTSPIQCQFTCIFWTLSLKGPQLGVQARSQRARVGTGRSRSGQPKAFGDFSLYRSIAPGDLHRRRNLDGTQPRYYPSNAPGDAPLETPAGMGGSRWRIETEFETERGGVRLDEYEVRSWAGWHHHTDMCLPGGAFLPGLQQLGGRDAPDHEGGRCTGWCGRCCPGSGSGRRSCCNAWRAANSVTSGPGAPTRNVASSTVEAGWSRHSEHVVVALMTVL